MRAAATTSAAGGLLPSMDQRNVVEVLRTGARRWPARRAVVDRVEVLTYQELCTAACRVAGGLRSLGVVAGDRVLLMLDNSVDHALAWFGSNCLNAVEVPLNTSFQPPQISYVAGHSAATVIVVDEQYVPRLRTALETLPLLRTVVVRGDTGAARGLPAEVVGFDALRSAEAVEPVRLRPADLCGILYTSGTTGAPKGVMVTQAQTYGRNWPLGAGSPRPDDITLVTLPIYHVIGQCRGLYNTLIAGGTCVLEPRFSATKFWDICREHGATYAPLVGVMAGYLLKQPPRADDRDNPVRHVALGTTIREVDRFRERFDVAEVSVTYGLTEVGCVLAGPSDGIGCGSARPGFDVRLVDEDDIEVPPGEIGELVVRPIEPWTAMLGYYRMPQETLERSRNLWMHTGDLMRRREDDSYVFVARRAERIRVRGENVSPADVEAQINGFAGVRESAVVGVADPQAATDSEQEILAVLVAEHGAIDLPELSRHLQERLPPFAVPRYFAQADALPRTESTQRVQRGELATRWLGNAWDRTKGQQ